ncbi:MAG: ComEC/Rec2 family competence protein [Candidatus Omnitrophica bacterium]|nr:ComEC/Rec2 family competence protein [Candidatus Omnitrophota bacterium]MDE2223310.1 ComEC/Rec2 family competence protein [Candidatus Omnitrophota bacterium]
MNARAAGGTHRPACGLAVILASGILIGHFLPLDLFFWLAAASLFIVLFLFWPSPWPVYLSLFCLGAALIHVAHPPAMDPLYDWRQQLKAVLYRYLDSREAGTMAAIVLGDRTAIPKEINMIFRHTGTGHILVIAGLHMATMAALVLFILKLARIPQPWQGMLAVFLIFSYAVLTGGSVPVMRAAIMTSVLLASLGLGLQADALNSLSLAAFILLLMKADDLFDISFQLSFAAVFAIILLYGPVEKFLSFCPKWLACAAAVSTAAWIGITPFQIWHFGTIAPVALAANLFVVPLLELTVMLGLGLLSAGLCLPPLAWCMAGCLKVVLNGMIITAFWFSQLPYGYIQLRGA